jgi:integrase/recombinase XerD
VVALQSGLTSSLEGFLGSLKARGRSERTIKTYRSILSRFMDYLAVNGLTPDRVTAQDIDRFILELTKKGWGQSSLFTVAVAVRSFLKYLGYNIDYPLPKRPRMLPKYLTHEELARLINACQDDYEKLVLGFLLTGVRVSELVNIRTSDIDLERRSVRVVGKGNKERVVFFADWIVPLLKRYLRNNTSEWLFPSELNPDQHIHYVTVERTLRKIVKRAGINKKVTPHVLRHTFATLSLASGLDIREIQELLGHSSLSSTQIYTHVDPQRLKQKTDEFYRSLFRPRW